MDDPKAVQEAFLSEWKVNRNCSQNHLDGLAFLELFQTRLEIKKQREQCSHPDIRQQGGMGECRVCGHVFPLADWPAPGILDNCRCVIVEQPAAVPDFVLAIAGDAWERAKSRPGAHVFAEVVGPILSAYLIGAGRS